MTRKVSLAVKPVQSAASGSGGPVGTEIGEHVFVAARYISSELVASEIVRRPASLAHAKVMGTTHTLCGLPTSTWPKLWERPFRTLSGERCPACLVKLSKPGRRGGEVRP